MTEQELLRAKEFGLDEDLAEKLLALRRRATPGLDDSSERSEQAIALEAARETLENIYALFETRGHTSVGPFEISPNMQIFGSEKVRAFMRNSKLFFTYDGTQRKETTFARNAIAWLEIEEWQPGQPISVDWALQGKDYDQPRLLIQKPTDLMGNVPFVMHEVIRTGSAFLSAYERYHNQE